MSQPQITQVNIGGSNQPGCLVQLIWWVLVGWWAGLFWVGLAWLVMLTVIGIPVGIWMINRISQVIALRSLREDLQITVVNGGTVVSRGKSQINILLRIAYFLVIGWWLSGIWMSIAYSFCLTVILLPAGFWMFDKTPGILTLQQ